MVKTCGPTLRNKTLFASIIFIWNKKWVAATFILIWTSIVTFIFNLIFLIDHSTINYTLVSSREALFSHDEWAHECLFLQWLLFQNIILVDIWDVLYSRAYSLIYIKQLTNDQSVTLKPFMFKDLGSCRTLLWIRVEHQKEKLLTFFRDVLQVLNYMVYLAPCISFKDFFSSRSREKVSARKKIKEHRTCAENISLITIRLAFQHLRSHISRWSTSMLNHFVIRSEGCEAEIGYSNFISCLIFYLCDEDIIKFDIAMNNFLFMKEI